MRIVLFAVLLVTCQTALAQFEDVVIRTTHVSGPIYMLEGNGGNLAVSVGESDVILVDDQFAPLTDKILAAIAELTPKPVRFVINTHWHSDHTGGNEELAERGSIIVAHDNTRSRLSTDQFIEAVNMSFPASPVEALPVITFNDRVTFHINGEAVTAFHTANSHTDGDIVIHFPVSNVIHMGDNFFNGGYPIVDHSSGGSVQGMIDSVQTALGLCRSETKVIPGHGPLANCADLESFGQMLADAMERIETLIEQGMSLEEIIEARPNAAHDDKLGQSYITPERFVENLYRSLTRGEG